MIVEKEKMPPIDFHQVYEYLDLKPELVNRIEELIELKKTISESYLHSGEKLLFELIEKSIDQADTVKLDLAHSNGKVSDMSLFFKKYVKAYDN